MGFLPDPWLFFFPAKLVRPGRMHLAGRRFRLIYILAISFEEEFVSKCPTVYTLIRGESKARVSL